MTCDYTVICILKFFEFSSVLYGCINVNFTKGNDPEIHIPYIFHLIH